MTIDNTPEGSDMMIADAINAAVSEHAVRFLLTAYLESLHHFHRSFGIRERVIALPVGDTIDLEERLAALSDESGTPQRNLMCIAEARVVLGCALARLATLAGADHRHACRAKSQGQRLRHAAVEPADHAWSARTG